MGRVEEEDKRGRKKREREEEGEGGGLGEWKEKRAITATTQQLYLPCHRALPGSSFSPYHLPWQQAPPQNQGMSCLECVERVSKTVEGPVQV